MFKKSPLSIIIVSLMLAMSLAGCAQPATQEASTSESASSSTDVNTDADLMTIAVEIDPSEAEGKVDAESLADSSISDEVDVPEGANAYDTLVATGVRVEGTSSYVTSINGLGEGDAGEMFGWLYEVNGEMPSVAADAYVLDPGDTVRWYYSSLDIAHVE